MNSRAAVAPMFPAPMTPTRRQDQAEKQIYVVGKTSDGQWAGFKTSVVET